ncbi:MAG: ABC transporter permease [Chloroflexi bacterium]|nr:ABC transporter permease [Chloroflexota bacterium]
MTTPTPYSLLPTPSTRRFAFPYRLELEPRLTTPRWLPWATSLGSVVFALVVGGLVLAYVGGDPIDAYAHIFNAAFGNPGVLSDTLVKASPLILTGLACLIAFRARLWNIGAEGQFFIGAFGATFVVQQMFDKDASPWLVIPTMALMGFACGALWGAIPGFLRGRFGVNEIITTLMMNYIAFFWNDFFIYGRWSDRGFQLTPTFPKNAWMPRLSDFADQFPAFSGIPIHAVLFLGLAATVAIAYLLFRTRWGYEIRLIGDNARAAEYAGINIVRNTVFVLALSGGLAGLAGMAEVSGVVHRLQERISPGYGFTAIIVAWLAKLNPWAVIPVAIVFGGLIIGSREIQPSGLSRMLQGIVLFAIIGSEILNRYRVRLVRAQLSQSL